MRGGGGGGGKLTPRCYPAGATGRHSCRIFGTRWARKSGRGSTPRWQTPRPLCACAQQPSERAPRAAQPQTARHCAPASKRRPWSTAAWMAGSMHMFDATLTSAWPAGRGWREGADGGARGAAAPGHGMHADRRGHPRTVAVSSASEHSTPARPVPHLYLRWPGYGMLPGAQLQFVQRPSAHTVPGARHGTGDAVQDTPPPMLASRARQSLSRIMRCPRQQLLPRNASTIVLSCCALSSYAPWRARALEIACARCSSHPRTCNPGGQRRGDRWSMNGMRAR